MEITGHKKGLWAESFAKSYLCVKGYRVLAERFKTSLGEIDLVVKRGNRLVFVEVKMRQNIDDAAESISLKNQSRVTRAAELYLQKFPEYNECEMRFDAIVIEPYSWPRHIENAW